MTGCARPLGGEVLRHLEHTLSLSEEAARWWVVFHTDGATSVERREFGEWLARGPDRVAAYLRMVRFHRALESPDLHWPDTSAADLVRAMSSDYAGVTPLHRVSSSARGRERPIRSAALRVAFVMSMLLVVAGVSMWFWLSQPHQYRTEFGEQRSILLKDGSRVTLNTDSVIQSELGRNRRVVRVLRGEALFEVAHDSSRPFDVHAGSVVFRAVGTQFDVDRRPQRTVLTVVEGRVALLPKNDLAAPGMALPILERADQVVVNPEGLPVSVRHAANVGAAVAWTRQQISFDKRPVAEVAEEFNRYNRDQIEVRSEVLRSQQVTGVFRSNRPGVFVDFLKSRPGVRVRSEDGRYVITLDSSEALKK
jgi:transmembrane sensor